MNGLDTNVVVRFLARDDPEQSAIATRLFAEPSHDRPGFLRASELVVERPEAASRALALFRSGRAIQFSDALVAATAALAGVEETVTFDRRAAAEAGMRLLRA